MEMEAAFSGVTLVVIVGMPVLYAAAMYVHRRRGRRWSGRRGACFLWGVCLITVAVSPPLAEFAHHDLRGHMLQHLLIGMFAPIGLVLAAPMTLTLRTLSVPAARWVTGVLRSRPVRVLSHPVMALVLNVGGVYVLYLTPLYAASLTSPFLHHLVHVHFLAAGYLFTWAILAGPDPAPHPSGMQVRLGVLFVSIAAHAILGKLMYGYQWPRGTHHSINEIQVAAQWMYYGGDLAEMLLLVVLFTMWYRMGGAPPYNLPILRA